MGPGRSSTGSVGPITPLPPSMSERIQSLTRHLVSCGLLALAACSSGSGDLAGLMFVESCSLGCNNGSGGDQVFCQIINAAQNQEIAIEFSQPVDPVSVDASTFRVVQVNNGTSPGGQFLIDPSNSRRLIFRPSLTFDQNGSPVYGFMANTSYQITLPGEAQGDQPPFIRSLEGRNNQSRLQCTIFTDQGVQDPVPGRPTVRVFADVVTSYDANGDPLTIEEDVELTMDAADTIDVLRTSDIRFVFSEIMNPATVADNASGSSNFMFVQTDADGMVETDNDRTDVEGTFRVFVDQTNLLTTATFTPTLGFPSGGIEGVPPTNPVFVRLSASVADIVGNTLTDDPRGETYGFFPERKSFAPIELPRPGGETFDLSAGTPGSLEDASRSGAAWGGGRLARGEGGGSGRLGDLIVRAGETVVLNTDMTTFPLPGQTVDFLGNTVGGDLPGTGANLIDITDGAFEFARVFIEAGGTLRFEGDNPARLFSRGPLTVSADGVIDVSGGTPEAHDSSIALPSLGLRVFNDGMMFVSEMITTAFGAGGPAAGDGGYGADRWNHAGNDSILALPGPPSDAIDITEGAMVPGNPAGRNGQGVGGQNAGRGLGGARNPSGAYPTQDTNTTGTLNRLNYNVDTASSNCVVRQVGGPGSGGGFAVVGGEGQAASDEPIAEFPLAASNLPPNTPGGDPGTLLAPPDENNMDYVVRTLEFYGGSLRGGAGGGGGGNHTYKTQTSDFDPPPNIDCHSANVSMIEWHDHSGAPGGGGGGAVQVRSGTSVTINGVVDASGGDGGSADSDPEFDPVNGKYAMPGGGGSGGGIMLGAPSVTLGPQPGRLDVSGGAGGATNFAEPGMGEILARGGDGSAGLVRIEDSAGVVTRPAVAPSILPFEPMDDSLSWVSVASGQWRPSKRRRPESLSGSTSCWVRPEGTFFRINYDSDSGPSSDEQAWNMDVIYLADLQGAEVTIPFRGNNNGGVIPNFEAMFGNLINADEPDNMGSPVAIRFQGARITAGTGTDFCETDLSDPIFAPGSITPWVEHPEELNDFNPIPNAMRFAVVFDRSVAPYATNNGNPTTVPAVRGITNLVIKASPE